MSNMPYQYLTFSDLYEEEVRSTSAPSSPSLSPSSFTHHHREPAHPTTTTPPLNHNSARSAALVAPQQRKTFTVMPSSKLSLRTATMSRNPLPLPSAPTIWTCSKSSSVVHPRSLRRLHQTRVPSAHQRVRVVLLSTLPTLVPALLRSTPPRRFECKHKSCHLETSYQGQQHRQRRCFGLRCVGSKDSKTGGRGRKEEAERAEGLFQSGCSDRTWP